MQTSAPLSIGNNRIVRHRHQCLRKSLRADFFADPVLLCNDLGTGNGPNVMGSAIERSGHASMSVKEAVRVAQSNNFMGLVCNSRLLVSDVASDTNELERVDHQLTPISENGSLINRFYQSRRVSTPYRYF